MIYTTIISWMMPHLLGKSLAVILSEKPKTTYQRGHLSGHLLLHMGVQTDPNRPSEMSFKDVYCTRKNMYRARRSVIPVLPRCIWSLLSSWNHFRKRQKVFFLRNDVVHIIIIGATLDIDGTFQYCAIFLQFFSVHGFKNRQYVLLVFALLSDKKSAHMLLFECIKIWM